MINLTSLSTVSHCFQTGGDWWRKLCRASTGDNCPSLSDTCTASVSLFAPCNQTQDNITAGQTDLFSFMPWFFFITGSFSWNNWFYFGPYLHNFFCLPVIFTKKKKEKIFDFCFEKYMLHGKKLAFLLRKNRIIRMTLKTILDNKCSEGRHNLQYWQTKWPS